MVAPKSYCNFYFFGKEQHFSKPVFIKTSVWQLSITHTAKAGCCYKYHGPQFRNKLWDCFMYICMNNTAMFKMLEAHSEVWLTAATTSLSPHLHRAAGGDHARDGAGRERVKLPIWPPHEVRLQQVPAHTSQQWSYIQVILYLAKFRNVKLQNNFWPVIGNWGPFTFTYAMDLGLAPIYRL